MDLNKDQLDILEFIKERKNVFITGGAGTGKSFLLKKITEYLKEAEKVFAVTAMTGSAAILINGRTLHSTLGIGLAKCDPIELLKRIIKMGTIYNYLKSLDVLIIDEVSIWDRALTQQEVTQIFSSNL